MHFAKITGLEIEVANSGEMLVGEDTVTQRERMLGITELLAEFKRLAILESVLTEFSPKVELLKRRQVTCQLFYTRQLDQQKRTLD